MIGVPWIGTSLVVKMRTSDENVQQKKVEQWRKTEAEMCILFPRLLSVHVSDSQFTLHSDTSASYVQLYLAAMSSSSPPQPQYWLGKPFIFMYWSGVTAETPPKYCGYGSLKGTTCPILNMLSQSNTPTLKPASTCIWICPWPQTGVWGTACGRCRCCGHSQAAGQHHEGKCSSSLHLWEPHARQRSAV